MNASDLLMCMSRSIMGQATNKGGKHVPIPCSCWCSIKAGMRTQRAWAGRLSTYKVSSNYSNRLCSIILYAELPSQHVQVLHLVIGKWK